MLEVIRASHELVRRGYAVGRLPEISQDGVDRLRRWKALGNAATPGEIRGAVEVLRDRCGFVSLCMFD